ncbi:hypothetical protein COT50_03560 [candidate division WWE3 bacterium CG08_land_8_20_14_0_20_41_10]|uniref:Glycosyltransferase RgtA/B/C/D-like domain-containing protein n=1 Tax=candidate division WWE3 bacterium CG08_land_8_20_14_0_20_41_10 TaxID=1975085 RepID=A0A2H0XB25_UNCKA|nr:MAG: hypothetical protein COT50_03560 [candidate division WWE3 bacterium CG08_land_8_20_14_0_20_41_10]
MKPYAKIIIVLTFLFGVFSVFKAPGDPDFGWHYKYGEYIAQHGRILRENVYSYTFTNYQWANSYWISQVAIYLTHHYLGHLIAGLLFAGILSASVIFYVKAVSKNSQPIIVLTTLSALLLFVEFSGSGVTGRPMYFSTLFLMFLVAVLFGDFGKKLLVLPLLFLLWANTHADFVLGLFILSLYVVENGGLAVRLKGLLNLAQKKWIRSLRRGEAERAESVGRSQKNALASVPAKRTSNLFLVIIGITSLAVTLINPYGFGLWQTLLKESHPYQFSYISEWVPASTDNVYYFIVYCATLGLTVSAFIGARHKLPTWYILALGFFCIASVRAQYFFRIAVILGIPAFILFWSNPLADLKNALSPSLTKKFKVSFLVFLASSALIISTIFLTDASQCVKPNYWIEKQAYPKEALDFALANNIEGNVFNYYGWGGYMIWQYPQIKTFVDGRMASWREGNTSVFEDYIKIVNTPKKNLKILGDYGIGWIVYPTDSEFVKFLKTPNSGWEEVFTSDASTLFIRNRSIITP